MKICMHSNTNACKKSLGIHEEQCNFLSSACVNRITFFKNNIFLLRSESGQRGVCAGWFVWRYFTCTFPWRGISRCFFLLFFPLMIFLKSWNFHYPFYFIGLNPLNSHFYAKIGKLIVNNAGYFSCWYPYLRYFNNAENKLKMIVDKKQPQSGQQRIYLL